MNILLGFLFFLGFPTAAIVLSALLVRRNRELQAFKMQVLGAQSRLEQYTREKEVEVRQLEANAQQYKDRSRQHSEAVTAKEGAVQELGDRLGSLLAELERYRPIQDVEAEANRLRNAMHVDAERHATLKAEAERLEQTLAPLRLDEVAREFGLYEPKYDLGDATRYKQALDDLRDQQKRLIKDGQAVRCDVEWQVSGSASTGRKMVKEIMQLMMFAFNGEAESLIDKVRFDNVLRIEERLRKLYEKINTLDGETQTYITQAYLNLKVKELHLVHEYRERKQGELEEQRRIREEMREEERAQRELEKAQQDAEKEELRYQQALEKARREAEQAQGAKQAKLQEEIQRLSTLLGEAHARKERAISQAQLTRSGHVYVISNVGSFGEDVYKIGMTRRLEPLDRVRELGDASVPFQFDVHAVIYTTDAPALEAALHRAFDSRRVNRMNPRKEFFRVTLDEIRRVVLKNHADIEFTLAAEAKEYRETQALRAKA